MMKHITNGQVAIEEGVVYVGETADVEVYNNTTAVACDKATVRAYDHATVLACDDATVLAYDSATVRVAGSAIVKAFDDATVEALGDATVEVYDSTVKVTAYGNATVTRRSMVEEGNSQS